MQTWHLVILGVLGGFAAIGLAFFLAIMLGRGKRKPWMAEPSGRDPNPDLNAWTGSNFPD